MRRMRVKTGGFVALLVVWFELHSVFVPWLDQQSTGNEDDDENVQEEVVVTTSEESPGKKNDGVEHLVFLHYHKTGHGLSRMLAVSGFRVKPNQIFRKSVLDEKQLHRVRKEIRAHRITIISAANLSVSWDSWLDRSVGVVHFVRDPLDWCLSAYLYHHQDTIPTPDKWIGTKDRNRCNSRHFRRDFLDAVDISTADLEGVSKLCQSLSNETALWSQLQQLSAQDGVRLEAARGLLGSSHGDLMLMGQHFWLSQQYQSSSPFTAAAAADTMNSNNIKTVFMSRFTESEDSFRSVAHELCSFGSKLLERDKVTVQECVDTFYRYGYLGDSTSTTAKAVYGSAHVTSHRMTKDEKSSLKQLLLQDLVLGRPLSQLRKLLLLEEENEKEQERFISRQG